MKTTKGLFAVLLTALMLAAFALPAFADVIIEPEDDFYKKNEGKCFNDYPKTYVARTDAGIPLYDEPGGKVIDTRPAGESMTSQWRYTDSEGSEWRFTFTDGVFEGCWFCTRDVLRLYNNKDFEAYHSGEFYNEPETEGSFGKIALYEYPNGPVRNPECGLGEPYFTHYYKDEDGREWGYISYSYGINDVWVCISDPANAGLSGFEIPLFDPLNGADAGTVQTAALTAQKGGDEPAQDPDRPSGARETIDPNEKPGNFEPAKNGDKSGKLWVVAAIVAACAAVCAGVLAFVFKKKGGSK